jgi:hypothetical protein
MKQVTKGEKFRHFIAWAVSIWFLLVILSSFDLDYRVEALIGAVVLAGAFTLSKYGTSTNEES